MSFSRWVIGGFLILLTGSIAYFNYFIKYDPTLLSVLYSVIILLVAYIVNILSDNFIKKQVPDAKERYTIKKIISTLISIISLGALLAVWIKETTTLVMAYGLLSAGVAIALQDLLKKCSRRCHNSLHGGIQARRQDTGGKGSGGRSGYQHLLHDIDGDTGMG